MLRVGAIEEPGNKASATARSTAEVTELGQQMIAGTLMHVQGQSVVQLVFESHQAAQVVLCELTVQFKNASCVCRSSLVVEGEINDGGPPPMNAGLARRVVLSLLRCSFLSPS